MADAPAARHALAMVRYIAAHGGPVRVSTLAHQLGLPRSTAYDLMAVLLDEGFVVHYPEDRAYGISALVSELGTAASHTERLARLSRPLLERLVAEARMPVVAHLAVLSGAEVVYVSKVQAFRAPTTVSNIGVRLPAHLTATGRALLAGLAAPQVRALYPHRDDLVRRQSAGPTTLAELDRILAAVRERGWSTENGDITPDYASVAAAATDHHGQPAAAFGLTFRRTAVDRSEWAPLGAAARAAAGALTARLAGRH